MVELNYFWLIVLAVGMFWIGHKQGYNAGLQAGLEQGLERREEERGTKPEGCYCHETLQPDQPFGGHICPVCEFRPREEGR